MRKIFSFALLALAWASAAAPPRPPADTATSSSAELDQHKLAADAVQQLAMLYAPAHTDWSCNSRRRIHLDEALVRSLRDKGLCPPGVHPCRRRHEIPCSPAGSQPGAVFSTAATVLPLRYVLRPCRRIGTVADLDGRKSIHRPPPWCRTAPSLTGYWMRARSDAMTETSIRMAPGTHRLAHCPGGQAFAASTTYPCTSSVACCWRSRWSWPWSRQIARPGRTRR